MANPPGTLTLSDLDARMVDALRDASVPSAQRYQYLEDAYSRIWYRYPWNFAHNSWTITASANVQTYAMDAQCAEVAAMFNATQNKQVFMRKDIFLYFQSYNDDQHGGPLSNAVDIFEQGGLNYVMFQETPTTATIGVGDAITVFGLRHIIHLSSDGTGATATGNMSVSGDAPAFSPQFHALIVKEALCEAVKNRRDFQEMYQLAKAERDEMMADMRRHYFTPRKSGPLRIIR